MAVKNHVHRLKKFKYKTGVAVFFCTLDCNYKIEAPFALGKETLCNICNEPFIMNEYTIKLTKPHCANCGRKEVKVDGKKFYIRKVKSSLLAEMAQEESSNLKDRLEKITTNPAEEDI